MQVWILTFNRPRALSRQIRTWGEAGHEVHVFSNHPDVQVDDEYTYNLVKSWHVNSLSYAESNSWCARSWNSIFIKAFIDGASESVFVQDDTEVAPSFAQHVLPNAAKDLDFIWGPAGDTFFYLKKEVLKRVGWFDERFNFCYCGDADFMKRIYIDYEKRGELEKLSIEETHDWGFIHNPIGIRQYIRWDLQSKCVDASYENQHWQAEKVSDFGILDAQAHWVAKWGKPLNGSGPSILYKDKLLPEIQWYPWFDKKYLDNKPRENGVYDKAQTPHSS
jgi:hypothetical protein